jgi:hypothetical protein
MADAIFITYRRDRPLVTVSLVFVSHGLKAPSLVTLFPAVVSHGGPSCP